MAVTASEWFLFSRRPGRLSQSALAIARASLRDANTRHCRQAGAKRPAFCASLLSLRANKKTPRAGILLRWLFLSPIDPTKATEILFWRKRAMTLYQHEFRHEFRRVLASRYRPCSRQCRVFSSGGKHKQSACAFVKISENSWFKNPQQWMYQCPSG